MLPFSSSSVFDRLPILFAALLTGSFLHIFIAAANLVKPEGLTELIVVGDNYFISGAIAVHGHTHFHTFTRTHACTEQAPSASYHEGIIPPPGSSPFTPQSRIPASTL